METKNTKKTNGILSESGETLNNWYNMASSTMNEIYKKQLNIAFGFYNNLFNSFLNYGKNNLTGSNHGFASFFNGDGRHNVFFNPLAWLKTNGANWNLFSNPYENFMKQVNEYNQNLLHDFKTNLRQNEWLALNEKYQRFVEERWEAARDIFSTLNDSYSRQLNFSIETNNKMLSELNKEINKAFKSTEEFWDDILRNYGPEFNTEETRTHKVTKERVHHHA